VQEELEVLASLPLSPRIARSVVVVVVVVLRVRDLVYD
jgi:hypothetical protein